MKNQNISNDEISNAVSGAAEDVEVQRAMKSVSNNADVHQAVKSASNDTNVRSAMMGMMKAKASGNKPEQNNQTSSFFSALSKNTAVKKAAVSVAKDEQVRKAVVSQAKKNAPLIKKAGIGAFKMGFAAYKSSNSSTNK